MRAADTVGRVAELSEEICWIESRRKKMEDYRRMVDEGLIPIRVTHNDTKINNILFDHKGDVLCVIDLDTVMPAPVHNDFGDAIPILAMKMTNALTASEFHCLCLRHIPTVICRSRQVF